MSAAQLRTPDLPRAPIAAPATPVKELSSRRGDESDELADVAVLSTN
ncbi:hypothetical protein GPA27_08955 [Aromatoleum toluolicum]|uniref:Uncharacterized protein n=1 Tax=Aromatoleum toluolicum TaxID=90060 RepID=A0ABX1NE12_9RHOO|nr:hypothetical protein [Aromatoleum toluolicum]NMF97515.1 hypothetical protein [Aromatoleum toluolicum]